MQLGWAHQGEMWLGLLLTLLLCSSIEGQENSFTINSINMDILPRNEVQNGENLTLQCIVDVSSTSTVKPQHQMLFYKNDVLFYNISTMKNKESFPVPQARVYDSGTYKCTVILNNKEKTSIEYQVFVRGVPTPRVTLDKKEAIEGGSVFVNCSVPEERPPIHFTIEKFKLEVKEAKLKREKTSHNQNFMMREFPVEEQDHIIYFSCQANIVSGTHVESSKPVRSEMVTVRESFTTPRFHVSPEGIITEGDLLQIRCTIQVTHLTQAYPEIIIQKDKAIVAHSKQGVEAVHSVMAMVEDSGHYKCKVETSRISKVSSIVVNITELFAKPKLEFSSTRLDQGELLSLWCSVPGDHSASFSIQKGDTIMSPTQNFTKIASAWDSGTYTCIARMGNVAKKSNTVNITVCEMLSTPRIFHNSRFEVIKGQTIEVSCQSGNGSWPIRYQLLKENNILDRRDKNSNDPAVFKDNPTKDVEYQCTADNCHSHTEVVSRVLRVKVIAPVDEVKLSLLFGDVVESGKTIALQCLVNDASGPITYRFYKEEEEGRPFYEIILNETQAIWYKAEASKEHEGHYYCRASNRANQASILQSNTLMVRVYFAPWKKALIAVFVIGVLIAILILAARCYVLKKGKAKQMPVEMSRPAVPLLSSNNDKLTDPNIDTNRHYGYNDDVANHARKSINENKDPPTMDVEYTEVQVTSPEPCRGLETKGTETVYSEIRKADPDFMENRYSRTEGSLDGT